MAQQAATSLHRKAFHPYQAMLQALMRFRRIAS
jgi:hypothetical protein